MPTFHSTKILGDLRVTGKTAAEQINADAIYSDNKKVVVTDDSRLSAFDGAVSGGPNGTMGLVPAPGEAQANAFLKGNGDWSSVAYTDLSGSVPTWNQNTTGSAGSVQYALSAGNGLTFSSSVTYNGSAARTLSLNLDSPIDGNVSGTIMMLHGPIGQESFKRTQAQIKASGIITATEFVGPLTGTADTATKLGTLTIGSTTLPIYLNAGVPTALTQPNLRKGVFGSAAIGSASKPVYIAADGVVTAGNSIPSVSSTPTNGATTTAISSDWAFDNVKTSVPSGALFTNTTYSIKASTQTGGAGLDLDAGGSGSGTDTVIFKGSGATSVTYTDANTIKISSTDNNNYLTGVTGSGNGTVTFTRNDLTSLTWNASHTHSDKVSVIGVYNGGNIDPNTTTEPLIITSNVNAPSTNFWYIRTFFYSSLNASRAQIAYRYNDTNEMYFRNCYGEVWTNWSKIAMASDIPTIYAWAKASTKPDYNFSEIAETTTYKSVTQEDKARWNAKSTLALGETASTAYSGSKGKANALAIEDINTALAGKLGTGDKAYDSARLGGELASQYVLASTLSTDYATKNYVTNSFASISSVTKIVNGTTQVGNTKKVAGKEVRYYTKSAFANITPVAGVHYIVYEN